MTTRPLTERVFLFHFPLFPILHILLFGGRDQEVFKSGRKSLRAALYYKNLQAERSGALYPRSKGVSILCKTYKKLPQSSNTTLEHNDTISLHTRWKSLFTMWA